MSPRERLEHYLGALRTRIRTLIYARAAATGVASVALLTTLFVWLLDRRGFPSEVAAFGRIAMLAALLAVALALVWWPLRKLGRNNGAREFERRLPAQQGRIETYLDERRREGKQGSSALLDLLAGDAAARAEATPVDQVIPGRQIWTGAALACVAVAALLILLTTAPGFWGYGSRYLLLGAEIPRSAVPIRSVAVHPGNITVRRNSDLSVKATVEGFQPDEAEIFVRFDDEQQWQRAPMEAVDASDGRQWQFKLYALRGPLRYYVEAVDSRGTKRSSEHSVGVIDLPHVERMRLTYDYPGWTDLPKRTEETVRDIEAVQGTGVKLEVFANAALEAPVVVVNGQPIAMQADGGSATGEIAIKQPGSYRISARVANELVALTDDYNIYLVADEKPTISIEKPARDRRATSIEEVPVQVKAQDDFRLQSVDLHYSINGGEWQKVGLAHGGRDAQPKTLLNLEELAPPPSTLDEAIADSLSPGDLISYYAVARDRNNTVQSDLFMVTVQPFERRFSQTQGGGGGGGGSQLSDEQGTISERQREILLATWSLQRSDDKARHSSDQLQDNANMLAEMQALLAQQARTLSQRTRARMSLEQDERIKQFVESLERAAEVMDPAAKHLRSYELAQAVPVEQQALQLLLRAEAAFRDVQVSMQQDNSGGGGAQAARNFAEMFELEMDVDKNHYETESQLSQERKQEELDDAIRKLKELAKRQEKLAQEAARAQLNEREQRWRQEQLRREAEDLQRRLAQLQHSQESQNANRSAQNQGQNQGQQQGQSQSRGDSRNAGQSSGQAQDQNPGEGQGQQSQQQLANAVENMRRALDDMRNASAQDQNATEDKTTGGNAGQSAREASRKLNQALRQLDRPSQDGLAQSLEQLAAQSAELLREQQRAESKLYDAIDEAERAGRRRGVIEPERANELIATKQQMAEALEDLLGEMRNAMNGHHSRQPKASQRLNDIVGGMDRADAVRRIVRSAAEIRYGRARDAAAREGVITEILDTLHDELRETTKLAALEDEQRRSPADPEGMLAQLGELRRALGDAQRDAAGQGQQQAGNRATGQPQNSQQGSESAQGQSASDQRGSPGSGNDGNRGLNAWNPAGPAGTSRRIPGSAAGLPGNLEPENGQLRRNALEAAERLRNLADRMSADSLSLGEINALRRMAHELRSLAGNPMDSQTQAMAKLVDRIELATLAAAQKTRKQNPSHTSASTAEEPQYREAVEEYYRRLGGAE